MYASIDLGGTTITGALADTTGQIAAERTIPTDSHEGPAGVLDRIARLINTLAGEVGHKPHALGMGVPGLIDFARGRTLFLPNLVTQWREVPVAETLQPKIGCPVFLLNDARAATLGELVFGHGKTARTMVFYTLGTGIGGGVVIDGKLRMGALGAAGELGHHTVMVDGPLCGCGNRGCIETLASAPAITGEGVRLMRSGLAPKLWDFAKGEASAVNPKLMMQAADAGDSNVRDALLRALRYLGIGAANMVVALHPELIVFGGGMAAIGPILTETVKAVILDRVRMFPADDVRVERSLLGDQAGILGGVALALKEGKL
ncbi:MAG: ROK family protein [Bryobacterales bacterium]|nr:ROK family protein [Bryobacterales bacterium]